MILSILLGVIIYISIGMLYYSPLLFGNKWVEVLNIKEANPPNYGLVSLVTLVITVVLYLLLQVAGAQTIIDGFLVGLLTGVIVTLAYGKDFLFGLGAHTKNEQLTFVLAAGYHLLALTIIGAVMVVV
ncbi:DUF1761 domain-containing protein [Alteribacter aurantiacus]|uniref:DUF1761 domain-containing protein n=1 Tax=Alteribacter aurantiacus TaxID=254410 RepID=UPI0003FE7BC3|nr:DUF1761 domain-containing protein [Alteribacter aurantiacus]